MLPEVAFLMSRSEKRGARPDHIEVQVRLSANDVFDYRQPLKEGNFEGELNILLLILRAALIQEQSALDLLNMLRNSDPYSYEFDKTEASMRSHRIENLKSLISKFEVFNKSKSGSSLG